MENDHMRILAVDDNADNLTILKALISEAFPQTEVLCASNGLQALEMAAQYDPDMVLLDIIMPGMDGYEVSRRLKSDSRLSDIPIVFVTALKSSRESRITALESGAEAFLSKPIDESELTAQIRAMFKIRKATLAKRDESRRLAILVDQRTNELKKSNEQALLLLQELKQSMKDLTESQQIAHVGTWRLNLKTNQVIWSTELYKMYGLNPMQPPPPVTEHAKLFTPKCWETLSNALDHARLDGTPYELELQTVRADGTNGWMWVRGEAERDKDGQITSIWGAAQDISRSKKVETELRESQERFHLLFNKAPLGYQSLDSNGCLLEINQKWLDTFGFDREDVEGRWFGEFLCPEYAEAFRKRFELFKAQGLIHSEFEAPNKSGERMFLSFEGKIAYDENGDFVQTHCILQDITNQRKAEAALRDSEERYKYLFENSGVGIGYYTTDGVVISYNKKALENIGGTLEDYAGKSVLDIFPQPEGETYYNRIQQAITTEVPQVYEDYLIFHETAKWFSSTITRITDAAGQVIGVQIASLDITNRKMAEEALSESQALLKAAFENSQAGIAIADAPDGKLRYVNKAGLLIRNKSEDEIVKNVDIRSYVESWQILHFDGSPYKDDEVPLARAVLYGESCSDEFIVRRDNMEDRYVLANAAPIKNSAGEITAGMVVFLDITEKRKAEEEINFLAYHDHLTNVFNRRYFEDEFVRLNGETNFPLAIITGDLNGLKLINDSIGHAAGDQAIIQFAACIREQIRSNDVLARVAGDEFGIILPQYSDEEASLLISRLQSTIRIKLNDSQSFETQIELSATFGYSVQTFVGQTLDSLMNEAETFMYRRKFYEDASKHSHVIDAIMNTLFEKSVREQQHSIRVSIIAAAIAEAMQFDEASVAKVRAAGALHDIGKIGIDERILNKSERLTELEWNLMKQHPVRSARILATIDAYLDIVPFVKSHHERYDGLGYPSGLSSTQIPLEARIICVADAFDAMTKVRPYRSPITKEAAAEELMRCAGSHFDPLIVNVFTEKVLPKLDMLAGLIQ